MPTIVQVIEKQEGMGPYFYTLTWHTASGQPMTSVYSTWEDCDNRRQALQSNGVATEFDLAVDYTRRVSRQ